jgi:hypothetical protein
VHDLCGFQAQFMANAIHSMRLRSTDFSPDTAGCGMVKNWTVRGTVHVFAESDLFKFRRESRPYPPPVVSGGIANHRAFAYQLYSYLSWCFRRMGGQKYLRLIPTQKVSLVEGNRRY